MTVYGVWHDNLGHDSYDWMDSIEEFSSIEEVRRELQRRWCIGRGTQRRVTVDNEGVITRHPAEDLNFLDMGDEGFLDLFNLESGEPYMRFTIDPRGFIQWEDF